MSCASSSSLGMSNNNGEQDVTFSQLTSWRETRDDYTISVLDTLNSIAFKCFANVLSDEKETDLEFVIDVGFSRELRGFRRYKPD